MKRQFEREVHKRRDNAQKGDYLEELRSHPVTNRSWSGYPGTRIQNRLAAREFELRRASQLYFVYGRWLYQNTRKVTHFVRLNGKHVAPDDPELAAAFEQCRQKWASDFPKIVEAIKKAPIGRIRGVPGWLASIAPVAVHWDVPLDLLADEIWRTIPPAFRYQPPRQTAAQPSRVQDQEMPASAQNSTNLQ